jgi:hypothetical protein
MVESFFVRNRMTIIRFLEGQTMNIKKKSKKKIKSKIRRKYYKKHISNQTGMNVFKQTMAKNGITGYSRSDLKKLYDIARSCSKINRRSPLNGKQPVTIPEFGAVPGLIADALLGFIGGSVYRGTSSNTIRSGLNNLLAEQRDEDDQIDKVDDKVDDK